MKHFFRNMIFILLTAILAGCVAAGKRTQGESEIAAGRYDNAARTYRQHLAATPGSAKDFSNYGLALMKTKRFEEAVLQFNKALNMSPGYPPAILHLGMTHLNKGEFEKAANIWMQYRNANMPKVEEEIKRLLTTVKMAQAQKEAEQALEAEHLIGKKPVKPNTMAISYLKDTSPDRSLRPFQKGLTAMLISDISKLGTFKVVEREKLQALLEEIKLGQTGIVNKRTAPRVGKLLRAENVITGNVSRGSIEAVIGVASSSRAGRRKGSATGRVEENRFFELPKILIVKIFEILKVKLTPQQLASIDVPHTKSYKAFTYFGNCIDSLDEGKWSSARDECSNAMREDPQFILARDTFYAIPSDTAPTIVAIKTLDIPAMVAAAERSIEEASGERGAPSPAQTQTQTQSGEQEIDPFLEGESGGGDGGGGGH